jgi:hypothetical protein
MLYEIAYRFPNDMIFEEDGPFISLYQPTHRSFPDNKKDTIVFKNLIRVIENSLEQKYDKVFVDSIMKPFHELEGDIRFWQKTSDGIAVLASQNKCMVYNLQGSVEEFATVADSFHIKPLIKAFQSLENYQLLGLSRNNFTLYQGNRYGFSEVLIDPDAPRSLEEVLGKELTEPHLSHGAYGGASGNAMFHGHGDSKKEIDIDTEKYFRYVDDFVLENYSKQSKLPLILVALLEYHSLFSKISDNPYLLDDGINISYDSLEMDEIKNKALEIIEPIISKKIQNLVESYGNAEAEFLASSDLGQIAKAAFEGRVKKVLIEENRIVPGKIDHKTGKISFGEIGEPDFDDILDDIAELVISRKGEVLILPKYKMPCTTGAAAIYRYL